MTDPISPIGSVHGEPTRRSRTPEYQAAMENYTASLLTAKQLAERLQVSTSTVYHHANRWGVLRVGGVLRFDWDIVQAALRARPEPPPLVSPGRGPGRPRRQPAPRTDLLPIRGRVTDPEWLREHPEGPPEE